MAEKRILDPGWAWDDEFPISQGLQVGNMIYISGQVAVDHAGQIVGKGDMKAQTRQVLENIKAILAMAGATLNDVVATTSFLTDIGKLGESSTVRKEYFGPKPPASASVEVKALAFPDLMIEIAAVAVKG